MKTTFLNGNLLIENVGEFSLKDTLDCGQCFRWDEQADGSFVGVVGKALNEFRKTAKHSLSITPQKRNLKTSGLTISISI